MKELGDNMKIIKPKKKTVANPHVALVKKWLDDPNSVTSEELKTNSKYAAADACRAEQIVDKALAAALSTTVASSCAYAAAQYAAYVSRSEGAIKPSWVQHVQSYIDRYDTRS